MLDARFFLSIVRPEKVLGIGALKNLAGINGQKAYIGDALGEKLRELGVIRRFQIVQDARDYAVLALETEPSAAESVVGASIGDIRRDLMTVFGSGMNLEITRVDRIPESDSGKFIACINKTASPASNEFLVGSARIAS